MNQLVITAEASADVTEAAAWYQQRSRQAAERFLLAVSAAFAQVAAAPTAHPTVDAATGTRRALLRKFPYRVLYLIDHERVVVFAVMHHHRDASPWRDRL